MPENKQLDTVKKEDYNKVVELQNSTKAENEKLKKELDEIKKAEEKKDEKTAQEKIEEDKKVWEKEKIEKDKMIENLKKKAEIKDKTKVSKGIISEKKLPEETASEKVKEKIDETLGKIPEKDPNKMGRMARFLHYKNPSTKLYNEVDLAKAIALQAEFAQDQIPKGARKSKVDIILPSPKQEA